MVTTKPRNDPFQLASVVIDGQFRADQVIGEGGYGVVYRGHHLSLDQPIAIKVLKVPEADDPQLRETILTRFRDEAKLLYTLSQASLNIVRSIHIGAVTTPADVWAPYTVLEWLEGRSLEEDLEERRRLGKRGRSLDETMALLAPAVAGLDAAHQRRVVHRDVKPANLFLLRDASGPRLKVLDFGIAKVLREDGAAGTRSKFASFTWLYGAPEQLDPRVGEISVATDVYAFALVMTEVLTDRVPTGGRDVVSLLKAATDPTRRPTPRNSGAVVSDAVESVFRRALAVNPPARYPSVQAFWSALDEARTLRASHPQAVLGSALPSPGPMPALTPPAGVPSTYGPSGFTPPITPPSSLSGASPPIGTAPPGAYPGPWTPPYPAPPHVSHGAATGPHARVGYPPTTTPYAAQHPPGAHVPPHPAARWYGYGQRFRPTQSGLPPALIVLIVIASLFTVTCSVIGAACSN